MTNKSTKMSRKGSMPFAMVAVTILLLSSAYGIAIASVDRTEDGTSSINDEIMSVSDAIHDTRRFIEAGIGRIINNITTDEYGGSLIDRMEGFDEKLDRWMSDNFPLVEDGNSVTVLDHDISLSVENMRKESTDGITPSFLKATGSVELRYINSSGSNITKIEISADGTSGLPFVVENVTRFELSACGCASALTELMTYQLSSLAQLRVLNGYGSISEYGDMGTMSIITEDDVQESLRSSLSILEELCFRTNGVDDMRVEHIDAAELLLTDDGYIEIDLSAVMSQALIAAGDQIVLKWYDLLWGSEILDLADKGIDGIKSVIRSIQGLFSNENTDSAIPYIRTALGSKGLSDDDYRFIRTQPYTLEIDGRIVIDDDWYGFYEKELDLGTIMIEIDPVEIDIFAWSGWEDFVTRYESGRNDIREYIRNVVHTAALECVSGYGSMKIEVNPYDTVSFSTSIATAFDKAFSEGIRRLNDDLEHIIDTGSIPDPLYQRICEELDIYEDEIFGLQTIYDSIKETIRERIEGHLSSNDLVDIGGIVTDALMESALESDSIIDMMEVLDYEVSERKYVFKSILSDVRKDNDGPIKNAMKYVMDYSLNSEIVDNLMRESTEWMITDMINYHELNVKSGIIDLSPLPDYELKDSDGVIKTVFFRMDDDIDVDVSITTPRDNRDKCSHYVDIETINLSPYTNVFTIGLKGTIGYRAESSDVVMDGLDWCDCIVNDSIVLDTAFDIPFVSGWGLCGVSYPPSHTIADELWERYGYLFEPLMEPLREVFLALKNIYSTCKNAMVEITAYLEELIVQLYSTIEEPLEKLQEMMEDGMLGMIVGMISAFDIGLGSQSVTMSYMSMSVTFETRIATLKSSTRSLCKLTMTNSIGDVRFGTSIDIKENDKNGIMVKCEGSVESDDWKIKLTVDPMMKFSKTFLKVTGSIRGVDFSASIPEIVQYDELELKVSDIPGVGEALSNIPLPIPDVKGALDMGLFLKYELPFDTDLVINEFESNPAGTDRGNEWVEIYNGTLAPIDLTGYTLVPGSDESKAIVLSGTIQPLGKKVFTFESQTLNNSNGKSKGECLALYDPDGNEVDSTPWKTDTYNDDRTWQRSTDGGKTWKFSKATKERSNGSSLGFNSYIQTFVIDSLMEAGETAFYKMGNHLKTIEDIEEFLKLTLSLFIENVIQKIADVIIGAGIFISIEIQDYAETLHAGYRISLEMNSELVSDGLRWLLSQVPYLSDYVNAPKCTDPLDIICNDTYLRTVSYWETSAPRILAKEADIKVMMGVSSAVNISGICALFGKERGTWKAEVGLVILDCPFELMPKKMKESNGSKGDLWLFRMTFEKAD